PCEVTVEAAVRDGVFVRRRGPPPYNHTCAFLKARYHTPPSCVDDAPPPWAWTWMLRDARDGRCVMPRATPDDAAAALGGRDLGEQVLLLALEELGELLLARRARLPASRPCRRRLVVGASPPRARDARALSCSVRARDASTRRRRERPSTTVLFRRARRARGSRCPSSSRCSPSRSTRTCGTARASP
ncbi:MAG: hypothetical protein VXY90_13880, partial [Pseudomonadota bacterium]|nr:hypothetical protein [Pseudomonadota bacterium]MEC8585853.1 hypothetical protein [Pseudomonadota bacterium]